MPNPILADCLSDASNVRHGFFTREGGVSEGIYAGLNCGLGSRDQREHVLANRARVSTHLGVPDAPLLTCHQYHSADVVTVETPWQPGNHPKADAMVTRQRGIPLGALAADCGPVLFCDAEAGVVGAAHAGWKGALGGVLEATIDAMTALGARRHHICAALGPCIGAGSYEVGPEFKARFVAADPAFAAFFRQGPEDKRPFFDLPAFVLHRLAAAGLETVENCATCTYSAPNSLFSYRRSTHRGEPDYGRQVSAIVLL